MADLKGSSESWPPSMGGRSRWSAGEEAANAEKLKAETMLINENLFKLKCRRWVEGALFGGGLVGLIALIICLTLK